MRHSCEAVQTCSDLQCPLPCSSVGVPSCQRWGNTELQAVLSELFGCQSIRRPHFGGLKGQATLPDIYERVMMSNVVMRCVLRSHYDKKTNTESPEYAWPDAIHDGVELDDAMQLQMFEAYVSTNPEICAHDCHIASKGAILNTRRTQITLCLEVGGFITTSMV
jgi:hypothetical protein